VPRAARGRWRVLLKGGWRVGLVHHAALVEGRRAQLAVVVLTAGSRSTREGIVTVEGVSRRLLG
jgi:hypothetical protein